MNKGKWGKAGKFQNFRRFHEAAGFGILFNIEFHSRI